MHETGHLTVIGLGPGPQDWTTPAALRILREATDLIGYGPYLDRVELQPHQTRHASDNRVELDRARHALELTARGRKVAVVSSGDPGVFAMAAAVFEALEAGDPAWRGLDIRVEPGITAVLGVASRLGAPLGHDFCVISLSDILKPWAVIEQRLEAAARGDFVIALYNPASRTRRDQIARALDCLRAIKGDAALTVFARAVGTHEERVIVSTLGEADADLVDMRTLVLVGSSRTRRIERPGELPAFIYTPRFVEGA